MITLATPTTVPNLVHIRPWGQLQRKWVKYNQILIYLYPFLGTQLQVTPVDRFSCTKGRGIAQICAFLGFTDIAPHLGGQSPKTPILEA